MRLLGKARAYFVFPEALPVLKLASICDCKAHAK